MKKSYLLLIVTLLSVATLFSQTQLIYEDFEAYTSGNHFVAQTSGPWTTWNGATGGGTDPMITSTNAYSGVNSVNIVADNDLVLELGDKTTGRYQIQFYMYVKQGHVAYFNMLQDFNGSNSEWGMQANFNVDGTGTVDAGAAEAGSFTFNFDEWLYVNAIVDVDDDFATLYIDSVEAISWQWSKGSFGSGTLHKLDAVNFYGWTDDNGVPSDYLVDNVEFTEQTALDAPLNLVASVNNNDIALTWDVPASNTPDSYSLMKNGVVFASGLTTNSYDDNGLYPNTYDYQARAHYFGLGYSPSSNVASGTIAGGVGRDVVLFEINTGFWCGYCPGASMGADDLIENGKEVAIIEYHNGDSLANSFCEESEIYYEVSGYPTTSVDGVLGFSGGNANSSIYDSYLPLYEERIATPSVYTLDVNVELVSGNDYLATITVEQQNNFFTSGLVLRAALTQSNIPISWAGLNHANFVLREMYPDHAGTALDFSSSLTYTTTINFSTAGYPVEDCEFIVFVQHDPTKEVIQANKVDMGNLAGVTEIDDSRISVYPNPASNYVNIFSKTAGTMDIYNISGLLVKSNKINNSVKRVDISDLSSGIYIIKVNMENQSFTQKLVIE